MASSETVGIIALVIAILALGSAGYVWSESSPVDNTQAVQTLQAEVALLKADAGALVTRINLLQSMPQTIDLGIGIDRDLIENLEDDIDDLQDDIDDIEDCARDENNYEDFSDCV